MNDLSDPASVAATVHLGIRGLPAVTDRMIGGGVYVLVAKTPPARFPILASSLGGALRNGITCSVIVPSYPQDFLDRVQSFGGVDLQDAIASNRLNVFEMQSEFPKKMFRFGAENFVLELEQLGIPENSYLLFDQADDLLALHDIALALDQLDILRKWFELRRVTALLVFTRATDAHAVAINALMDNLTGITRLGGGKDGLEMTFDYWQSPDGTVAASNYSIERLESGFYEASTRTSLAPASAAEGESEFRLEAADAEPHFFYMDPDLASLAKQIPGIWQRVDTLVGMMHATRNTRSATSILTFNRTTNLRQLAEAVHTLRLSLGNQACIVVQEKDASLRYQNEALLLHLGLNLVVHRDVPTSRLSLLLESLSGQIFNRDVDINFEAALSSVSPTSLRGYLLPLRFAREVSNILDRAETLNIPFGMFVGKPVASASIGDIIATSGLSRPGDLISSDGERCFIFLNACPQPAFLATLQRIFGQAVDTLFEEVAFIVEREEVRIELEGLSHRAEQNALPDYSSFVIAPVPLETAPAVVLPIEEVAFSGELPPPVNTFKKPPARPAVAAPTASAPIILNSAGPAPLSTPLPPVAAPVVPIAEETATAGEHFSYDTGSLGEQAFRKKEAPRATRSVAAKSAPVQRNDDTMNQLAQ